MKLPPRDRGVHGGKLRREWTAIWAKAKKEGEFRTAVSKPAKDGVYIEFEGAPGYDLKTKSLEDRGAGIRLLNVYTVHSEKAPAKEIVRATVFIPSGKQNYFLGKITGYIKENTARGKPKNAPLIQSIEEIRIAVFASFWRDDAGLMPRGTTAVWCEVWLRGTDEGIESSFRDAAEGIGIELHARSLRFPERTVLLGKATYNQLNKLLETSPDIAEFRRAKETARYFLESENQEQAEWVKELQSRLLINPNANAAVCVLDTGANNGHALLQPILADSDCQAVDPEWGATDHDGHGTQVCGVAAYGDLVDALQRAGPIQMDHRLESVKILPARGENDPGLYGAITIQGVSLAEIQAPERNRVACMAVTSGDGRDRGRPSSWSAAIDKLTSGYDDDHRRLLVIAAGNLPQNEWAAYPRGNSSASVQDPGQSWNAITVGAFTAKSALSDPKLQDYVPLAQPGELSPFSSTSCLWDRKWPAKPDIVMEGGNAIRGQDGFTSGHDELSLLTTNHRTTQSQFTTINATSAAAAQAARMAAMIQARYPEAWPETIRGLVVHSADWQESMKRQFCDPNARGEYSKTDYGKLLRIFGYGVPSISKGLSCASNSLTLISEAELQPYTKKGSSYSTRDMHLHRLPWPRDVLLALGEAPVTLRITLSYFIEPSPGEVGWKDRYRYASHGLRFGLNTPGETEDIFLKRLNKAALDAQADEKKPDVDSGSGRWLIGSNGRDTGSLHSDIWKNATAADIATCNFVGVYPVIGWWRERGWLGRWDRKARYSLIVSLYTPDENVDIYTPVAISLGIPIEIQ
ncbi:MAG: S8 family peptidase [Planctomycetota bacterium]|jgi:hypothetical protein|nr:S8 family peptidase [Planctomycetota bacterium]